MTRCLARFCVLTAIALSLGFSAQAAYADGEIIKEIVVEDNSKTTDETVLLIANVEVGDTWTPALGERIKQDLISSGLFKKVSFFWDPLPTGGIKLYIAAKDKFSWVAAPTFYWQPTNKGGGVGFGENNLFGENKKLLMYGQIATGDTFFIGAYVDPSIAGSAFRWQTDVYLRSGRIFEYASPKKFLDDPKAVRESRLQYLNAGVKVGVELWRALGMDVRLRGARVSYKNVGLADGATIEDVTGDATDTEVPAPGREGYDVSSEFSLTLDKRADYFGIASGYRVGFNYEQSVDQLGSDFKYWYGTFTAERYLRFGKQQKQNLVIKTKGMYGHDIPFQQEFQSGGTTMRGYKNSQFRGDFRVASNLEYSVPMFTIAGVSFRGLGFWDSAYTAFLNDEHNTDTRHYLPGAGITGLAPWKNSVGAGIRLYMKQIVIPLLGVDVGWGLERGGYEIYMAIGLTD